MISWYKLLNKMLAVRITNIKYLVIKDFKSNHLISVYYQDNEVESSAGTPLNTGPNQANSDN